MKKSILFFYSSCFIPCLKLIPLRIIIFLPHWAASMTKSKRRYWLIKVKNTSCSYILNDIIKRWLERWPRYNHKSFSYIKNEKRDNQKGASALMHRLIGKLEQDRRQRRKSLLYIYISIIGRSSIERLVPRGTLLKPRYTQETATWEKGHL